MLRQWLQLFRVPNLFTVPGDPIAGFLLAYGWTHQGAATLDGRVVFAVCASLCLYAGGLAMNDLADLAEDRRDRPKRPLPSGAIAPRSAAFACAALCVMGLILMMVVAGTAGLLSAVAVLLCVAFYNVVAKRIPFIGPLVMGACRGLSLLLGSVACTGAVLPLPVPVFAGAVLVTLYIAAVTNLASHETKPNAPAAAKILPGVPLLLAVLLAYQVSGPILRSYTTTLFVVALLIVAVEMSRLIREAAPRIPPIIGTLIRTLMLIQAGLCVVFPNSAAGVTSAIVLVLLAPLARIVGRRFYAS